MKSFRWIHFSPYRCHRHSPINPQPANPQLRLAAGSTSLDDGLFLSIGVLTSGPRLLLRSLFWLQFVNEPTDTGNVRLLEA